jgi:hypothetical protein
MSYRCSVHMPHIDSYHIIRLTISQSPHSRLPSRVPSVNKGTSVRPHDQLHSSVFNPISPSHVQAWSTIIDQRSALDPIHQRATLSHPQNPPVPPKSSLTNPHSEFHRYRRIMQHGSILVRGVVVGRHGVGASAGADAGAVGCGVEIRSLLCP